MDTSRAVKRSYVRPSKVAAAMTLEERFWEKVDQRGPDECWPWMAHIQTRGYGQFYTGTVDGKEVRVPAHRMAWELHMGVPVPKGLVIDHICKNTACCNPHHLRPVRQYDNCMHLARPSPFYLNSKKDECINGHPYTPENTAWPKKVRRGRENRGRICLTCYPTYWRWAEVPRERPPGSRFRPEDPDYNERP
jgi:hypothetical protein